MQNIANIPEICSLFDVSHAVISPGSRNAPLIFSFTASKKIHCLSIVDERSAGYFALGIAQNSNNPVVLICTSGTAVLNYAPAIAEAYYQGIPLIVLTADRPPELIDQNDGQAIRQPNIFNNIIKASYNLPISNDASYSDRIVYEALQKAISERKGPIHINVPLREPLYEKLPAINLSKKYQKPVVVETNINKTELELLRSIWSTSGKKMIICGFNATPDYKEAVLKLSERNDTVVIAENIANISSKRIIFNPDPLFHSAPQQLSPDLIITVGNSIVSKRLKLFLRNHDVAEHWHIHESNTAIDTFNKLTKTIHATPKQLLNELSCTTETASTYSSIFNTHRKKLAFIHDKFVNSCPYSDLKVVDLLLKHIPTHSDVHLSNSTSIRYSQLFKPDHTIRYFSNRGTSGIDGCTSTALGSAFSSQQTTTIITGDIAFLYDSNALWNKYLEQCRLKIIVLNNKGGNIFSFIQSSSEYNKTASFFTTPQQINIEQLARAYNINYYSCQHIDVLPDIIESVYDSEQSSILEIITDQEINTKTYKAYFQLIQEYAALVEPEQ